MNESSTFKKLKTKQYEFTGKQRLIVLGAIGIIVILIFFYFTTSNVEEAVGPQVSNSNSQVVVKALGKSETSGLQTSQVTQSMRDPFSLPPDVKAQNIETGGVPTIPNNGTALTPGMVPKSVIPNNPYGNLKLTGIVGTTGRNLAVIMSDNKSKSYGVNEFVGTYKIVAITNDSVVLANGDNKLVLRLESSGLKGGKDSEK